MEGIELEYVKIFYKAPIIHLVFKEGTELGIPEVLELTTCAEKLSGGKPYVILSDVRVNMDVTHEGRRLAARSEEAPLHKASAVLVKKIPFTRLQLTCLANSINPNTLTGFL
jgi:hypothetical protein